MKNIRLLTLVSLCLCSAINAIAASGYTAAVPNTNTAAQTGGFLWASPDKTWTWQITPPVAAAALTNVPGDAGLASRAFANQVATNAANRTSNDLVTAIAAKQASDSDLTTIAGLADPNADRILFWDDSAGAYAYLVPGTGIDITGTTISASGGVGSGSMTTAKEDGAQLGGADIVSLDFLGVDFDLTETPDTEINIVIAAAITRDAEWDTEAEVQTAWGGVNILLATELDTSAKLRGLLGDETGTGAAVFGDTPTILTPTIASFINANHSHQDAAGGGTLDGSAIGAGTVADARIASTLTRDTEWDTIAEIETAIGSANIILATEIDTLSELEAILTGANLLTETEIDASSELAAIMDDETGSGALVFGTSPTIVTPTIASFANANHSHQDAAGGGTLSGAAIASGTVAEARIDSAITRDTEIDSSAELRTLITDETGTGAAVFAGGDIGAATATTPGAADNDTSVATTAFVEARVAGVTNVYEFALSDETTEITTGVAKVTWRAPFAMTIIAVRSSLSTTSSSGLPTVDIKEGGSTILSTKLSIDASEKTSTTAAAPPVISDTAIADDAEITFDIDTAGTGAKGLKVKIYFKR